MKNQTAALNYEGDLFSFAGVEAPEAPQPAVVPQQAKRVPPVRESRVAAQKPKEPLVVNIDTIIRYLGDNLHLTDYFTAEEIERGLPVEVLPDEAVEQANDEEEDIEESAASETATHRPIDFEEIRKRLEEREFAEMVPELTRFEFVKEKNMILPIVTAKSKGAPLKIVGNTGVYSNLTDASNHRKRIMYIATRRGWFVLRETEVMVICSGPVDLPGYLGSIHLQIEEHELLPDLKEGVTLKIPKIRWNELAQFVTDARFYAKEFGTELHGEIFWHPEAEPQFHLRIPKQTVYRGKVDIDPCGSLEHSGWIKVMEIHSHHEWPAIPSATDNANEVCPILYAIIGKVDQFFPDLTVRTCLNGKHIPLQLGDVFASPFENLRDCYLLPRHRPFGHVRVKGDF